MRPLLFALFSLALLVPITTARAQSSLSDQPDWTIESDFADAFLGNCAEAGDVNGDGYPDVLIGLRGYSNPESNEGRVDLYLGSASGLGSTPQWSQGLA